MLYAHTGSRNVIVPFFFPPLTCFYILFLLLFFRCESCVELLFVRGSGTCQECDTPLRKSNFRVQLFEDPTIDKEVEIRKRIIKM